MQALIIFLVSAFFLISPGHAEPVRVGYFIAQPHIIFNESAEPKLSGALVEFLDKYIGPEMGVEFIWNERPINIPRQLKRMKEGSQDMIAVMRKSEERMDSAIYTEMSFYDEPIVLAFKKDHPIAAVRSVDDIVDFKIGFADMNVLSAFMQDERLNFSYISSPAPHTQNIKKLMAGRIDAVYSPSKTSLLMAVKKAGLEDAIKLLNLPEPPGENFVAFSINRPDLVKRYNEAFIAINGKEKYQELLKKYLDISDR